MTYFVTDTCDDVFKKYCEKFFTRRLCLPFIRLFRLAQMKVLLTGIKIQKSNNEELGNLGPIDFFVRMNDFPTEFKLHGTFLKPPHLKHKIARITLYQSTDKVRKIKGPINVEDNEFYFDIQSVMFPIGMYVHIQVDGCYQ